MISNSKRGWMVILVSGVLAFQVVVEKAVADVIEFRNDARVSIRFSIRDTTDTSAEVKTETLEVGGTVQFDLPETGSFDICATGLDSLNGTFGETRLTLPDLLNRMVGNQVGVNGTICCGKRTSILLSFPIRGYCRPLVVRALPASKEYVDWFYYGENTRD